MATLRADMEKFKGGNTTEIIDAEISNLLSKDVTVNMNRETNDYFEDFYKDQKRW